MTKTVLITGCSSGFGAAAACLFADNGWNVVATMRTPAAACGDYPNVLVTKLDVQNRDSITSAVSEGIKRFGQIDVVVNNAGYGLFGVFEGTSREKVQEQFDVNVFGMMDVIRETLPHFRANRSGLYINVSSGAGVFGLPMISLYNASKFALEGFSESLSYELASLGIGVKIVEPGGVLETKFGQRSGQEFSSTTTPPDYELFITGAAAVFDELRQARGLATSEDVAKVIFEAATDGTNQLRYVATEDIKPLIDKRRESSEAEYMAFMRERMTPKPA
ncbi:NAD(P)-dependent dehydrogenase (short-subunit alcohol dehydrogenase family) [Rhizobium sp. BIGb0125]|uniref:SDR family oxidoreductase n=1 Tax=Rhizobium sp. BIGb0125 TaxID=2940618 RepID=UPI002168A8A7|nr:SDR family oxidoreductase [Rhizobium sp. BIGb0125]MCS4243075.1 NAD(P)-dependent dehydrogenase (short-subunit alcohol dehydrogenase family) [Rhizobium sp. BIGb0125]